MIIYLRVPSGELGRATSLVRALRRTFRHAVEVSADPRADSVSVSCALSKVPREREADRSNAPTILGVFEEIGSRYFRVTCRAYWPGRHDPEEKWPDQVYEPWDERLTSKDVL